MPARLTLSSPLTAYVLTLALAFSSGGAAGAQELLVLGWEGMRRPSKYQPRDPGLLVPPDLPGRQTLVSVAGVDGGIGGLLADGPRRYLTPETFPSDRHRAWRDVRVFVREASDGDAADEVAAYDLIGEYAAATYREQLDDLDLPTFRPKDLEQARVAIDILWRDYCWRLEDEKSEGLAEWRALLALCREIGLSARVGFGLEEQMSYPPTTLRALWLEVCLPDQNWVALWPTFESRSRGAPPPRRIAFGFLGAPGVPETVTAGVPAYPEPVATAWMNSRGQIGIGEVAPQLLASILPLYRTDDARFVREAGDLLRLVPGDFDLLIFRAVALARLGRLEEARPIFELLLQRRAGLSEGEYAHLLYAFAKYLGWSGHEELALRYLRQANEASDGIYYTRLRSDPDWVALMSASPGVSWPQPTSR